MAPTPVTRVTDLLVLTCAGYLLGCYVGNRLGLRHVARLG